MQACILGSLGQTKRFFRISHLWVTKFQNSVNFFTLIHHCSLRITFWTLIKFFLTQWIWWSKICRRIGIVMWQILMIHNILKWNLISFFISRSYHYAPTGSDLSDKFCNTWKSPHGYVNKVTNIIFTRRVSKCSATNDYRSWKELGINRWASPAQCVVVLHPLDLVLQLLDPTQDVHVLLL